MEVRCAKCIRTHLSCKVPAIVTVAPSSLRPSKNQSDLSEVFVAPTSCSTSLVVLHVLLATRYSTARELTLPESLRVFVGSVQRLLAICGTKAVRYIFHRSHIARLSRFSRNSSCGRHLRSFLNTHVFSFLASPSSTRSSRPPPS